MKPRQHFLWITLLLFSSCRPISSTMPTETAIPFPTLTPIPLIAHTSTFEPQEEIMTLTLPVTLEPERARDAIKVLLERPQSCKTVCFWGITPEQTTLNEAEDIFSHLGLEMEYVSTLDKNTFYNVSYNFESGLSVSVNLTVYANVVISLKIGVTPEIRKAGVAREWLTYSPEALINQHGLPSNVSFFLGRGPLTTFVMYLYFDRIDLIVEYVTLDLGTRDKICPLNDQIDFVRIWLGKNPESPNPSDMIPLDYATSLNIEEFSNLMIGDIDIACFTIYPDAFP